MCISVLFTTMAAINDLEMEIKQLKNRIEDLVKELEEKENQVVLSAQFGKELLESNTELNHQLEEMQESCLMQVEVQNTVIFS